MSNAGSHPNPRKALDLTSRLYANSLHTGALTEKGPALPWVPSSSSTSAPATSTVHANNETITHNNLHTTSSTNNNTVGIFYIKRIIYG